jgi:hypothetical protein
MSKPAFLYNDGTLTVVACGRPFQVGKNDPKLKRVQELLLKNDSEQELAKLLTPTPAPAAPKAACAALQGRVTIDGNVIKYDGQPVHRVEADRILALVHGGYPVDGMVNFLERVMKNPSFKSRGQLYNFMEHKGLPVTEDGYVLAYKAVRSDWMDKYSGTLRNQPGDVVSIDRSKVDDEQTHHCSHGLHCGAMDYVTQYGGGDDRIVLVKFDPADAVSVPTDSSYMKLRVCKYTVVKEYEGDLVRPLYTAEAEDLYADDEYDGNDDSWLEEVDSDGDSFDEGEATSSGSPDVNYHNKRDAYGRFVR